MKRKTECIGEIKERWSPCEIKCIEKEKKRDSEGDWAGTAQTAVQQASPQWVDAHSEVGVAERNHTVSSVRCPC